MSRSNAPHAADQDDWVVAEARVGPEHAGLRFDQAAAALLDGFSRARLTAWIRSGELTLDGTAARPRDPVRIGSRIYLRARMEAATAATAQTMPLSLLYADEHLLIVDKPAGLVVHPGAGNPDRTLVNGLIHFDPRLEQLPRAGIVHRLDKDTSGALLVARTPKAHAALVELLAARGIQRHYLAVVHGVMVAGGTVDAPLARHPTDRLRRAVVEHGRPAITHYRVRERFRAHTLIECRLETGRTHQIRVHMQHVHHPLVGDPLYGAGLRLPRQATSELAECLRSFRRQALHAERLALEHPCTGRTIEVHAPLPPDFQALVSALQADAKAHG